MPLSNFGGNSALDTLFDTNSHAGLFTTMPTNPGNAGTEMSGGSYVRVDISALFGAAGSKSKANDTLFQIICNTGTVLGVGIWDASTSGNLKGYDELLATITGESNVFATSGEGIEVITLANADVRNVIVKDVTDVTTYTEGTDYYVQYESGKVIRISTGAISSGATVHVTYGYPTSRSVLNGDKIEYAIGQLVLALKGYK